MIATAPSYTRHSPASIARKWAKAVLWILIFGGQASLAQLVGHSNEELHKVDTILREDRVGYIVTAIVQGDDTIILSSLPEVRVIRKRIFHNWFDYQKYYRYMRYAKTVYPYAVESMRLYRQIQRETAHMSRRQRRRYINRLNKALKKEYKEPLKNLTRTQGYILIKMIERELGIPFYQLIRDTRGWWTATYYQNIGKIYGYNLKKGYIPGEDPILDIVLDDFDIMKSLEVLEGQQCDE